MNSMQIFTNLIYRIVHNDHVSTKLSLTFLISILEKSNIKFVGKNKQNVYKHGLTLQ